VYSIDKFDVMTIDKNKVIIFRRAYNYLREELQGLSGRQCSAAEVPAG
jgi:hypothetical protein